MKKKGGAILFVPPFLCLKTNGKQPNTATQRQCLPHSYSYAVQS
ncbi:hypothetical protein NU10_11370 [Flavobacterium dauae]|nr:hypothetical protein [Flavobacterium dauae]WLD23302.1 hypothetical protein NU10_11370 [Flavobacterium dauae]